MICILTESEIAIARIEDIQRIALFLDTGEIRQDTVQRSRAAGRPVSEIKGSDLIGEGFVCSEACRAFFTERIGPSFSFSVPFQKWLKAHAGEYHLDPERFAIAGDSAGAYHALFAAATQEVPAFDGPEAPMGGDSRVKAAIGLFGVYDLAMQAQFSFDQGPFPGAKEVFNFADMFAGGDTRKCRALGYLTDCKTWVTPAMPRVLIQCGDHDQIVPYKASLELADRIRAVCGEDRAELDIFPGALHGDPAYITKENIERLFRFLDSVLK